MAVSALLEEKVRTDGEEGGDPGREAGSPGQGSGPSGEGSVRSPARFVPEKAKKGDLKAAHILRSSAHIKVLVLVLFLTGPPQCLNLCCNFWTFSPTNPINPVPFYQNYFKPRLD